MFGYSIPHLYTDKDDVFVNIWQIYRLTGERERPGYIAGRDPGKLGCPLCVGQVWGSEVFGEPFDESWRALVGPDYQLLGSRA